MLDPGFARVGRLPGADPARVPQLRGNAEIFAAAHHAVGLAAFGGGGDGIGGEVWLLAAGDGDESGAGRIG